MSQDNQIRPSEGLRHVKYEIRGRLARRAQELERQGYEIVPLNIGNPAAFGFRTPETMRLAMIENMPAAEGYCHQKGIFPAREAVVMQQQMRGALAESQLARKRRQPQRAALGQNAERANRIAHGAERPLLDRLHDRARLHVR